MPIDRNDNFKTLIEDYHKNPDNFVFFVGAGLSMPLFPSWKEFLTELVDKTQKDLSDEKKNSLKKDIDSGKSYLDIAEDCANSIGKARYEEYIIKKFDIDIKIDRVPPSYKALMELSPNTIITTNYDRIPDIAGSGTYSIFTHEEISYAAKQQAENKKVLIKLHGKVEKPSTIILKADDYSNIMYNQPPVKAFITSVLTLKKVIFIGSSLSDPHINEIIKKNKAIHTGITGSHYILLNESEASNITKFKEKYSVNLIPYTTDDHSEVVEFLQALNPKLKPSINHKSILSDKASPPQKKHSNPHYLELNKSEENQLVKILIQCSSLNQENTFEQFLNDLNAAIGAEIKHNKEIEYRIHNIIDTCLIDKGNTKKLIALLDKYEKDQSLVSSFKKTLKKLRKQAKFKPIPNQYIKCIEITKFNLPGPQKLKTIYTACLPELMPDDSGLMAENVHDFINSLAKLSPTKSTGKLPLFEFLIQLMPHAKNPQKTKKHLQTWLSKTNSHLKLNPAKIEHLLKPLEEFNCLNIKLKAPKRLYLLIELQADEGTDASFNINAWYGTNSKQLKNISPFEETIELNELQDPDFMQNIISGLLNSARREHNMADNQLSIEFFLPFCLLNHPVEHWIAPGSTANTAPIGTRFPIVVRSQDRFRNEGYRPNWDLHKEKNKFDKTESNTQGISWKESEQPKSMPTDFGNAKNSCLAITFPYKANVIPESMLVQAICQGAPIAIWLRQVDNKEKIREELEGVFSKEVLEDLPERVRKWRSKKYGAEQPYHLALFWDDPKRVPQLHFNSPTQE